MFSEARIPSPGWAALSPLDPCKHWVEVGWGGAAGQGLLSDAGSVSSTRL